MLRVAKPGILSHAYLHFCGTPLSAQHFADGLTPLASGSFAKLSHVATNAQTTNAKNINLSIIEPIFKSVEAMNC